jgi:PIN domain nuclease of toxin-antitoxin system
MRALIGIAAAGLAAVGLGFWLSSATDSTTEISSVGAPTTVSQISIWEIHNQAHLEFLPVQQIEDQSLIFTASEATSSERR